MTSSQCLTKILPKGLCSFCFVCSELVLPLKIFSLLQTTQLQKKKKKSNNVTDSMPHDRWCSVECFLYCSECLWATFKCTTKYSQHTFFTCFPNITVWLLPKAKCSHPRINVINPIWDLLEWRGTGQSRGRLRLGDDAAAVAVNAYMLWRTSSWCSPWCGSAGSPGLEGSHYTWDTHAQGYSPDAASQYLKVRDTDHNSSLLDGCSSSTCIFWQTDYTTKVIQSNVLAILDDFCCI